MRMTWYEKDKANKLRFVCTYTLNFLFLSLRIRYDNRHCDSFTLLFDAHTILLGTCGLCGVGIKESN
jgi:hypothetical protein